MKKTKDQVQEEAELAINQNGGKGIVVMATGTGKSKIVINRAKRKYKPTMRILIVVPTEKLRDVNWKNEFSKWDCSAIYENNVERACYISINKIHQQHYDLVVLDEVHNITENNSEFFSQNTATEVIGLTATMPENYLKKQILESLKLYPVYHVSLDEAVEWGLISPYKITIVEVKLNSTIKNIKAGTKEKPFMQTEFEAYKYVSAQIERLVNGSKTPQQEAFLMTLIFKRLRLIYNLETKTRMAKFILDNVIPKDERTLIFCGSIKQAEFLNEYSFHSKSKNSIGFDKFVNEEIERLSCVNALNEGHNIPNVDNALVVQLNSKELNLVQRIGRIVRYRHGHIAEIFIIMVCDTVDENWTYKSLTNFESGNIRRINFEQLKSEYGL
jgi:superfamily II DNA or RNA helicase